MSRVNIEGGRVTGIDVLETVEGGRVANRAMSTGVYSSLSNLRHEMRWAAGEQGKPGLNADLDSTDEAVRVATDKFFEVLGTNATSALCTHNVGGGIRFTTAAADADEMILVPHLDSNQTGWDAMTGDTGEEVTWECMLRTSSLLITNTIIWAGLKLTNTEVEVTDADQVYFRYEDDVNSGKFQFIYSIGGTDVEVDTGLTVVVDQNLHLKIVIDSLRIARGYINGVLVGTSTALTDSIDLKPYIGVADDGSTRGAFINIYGQSISRKVG